MNKTVLITGASSGIGRETAILLAGKGYTVYGAARSLENIPSHSNIRPLRMDLTDSDSIEEGVGMILAESGAIDVLINNAGYGLYGTVEDVPLDMARREMEVNLFCAAHLCQLVLPGMRRRGYGLIINISSIAGKMATPLGGWYHASKYALEGLSDALRQETAPYGIDVVIIEPGIIRTPWWSKARKYLYDVSKGSDYGKHIAKWQKILEPEKSSDPTVIARKIADILGADKPKPRYRVGKNSGIILTGKKILSDRGFDRAVEKVTERGI